MCPLRALDKSTRLAVLWVLLAPMTRCCYWTLRGRVGGISPGDSDARVRVAGVSRVRHRALERILELLAARAGCSSMRASVFHADALPEARWLARQVESRFRCSEFFMSEFTPVMGAHTGPGTIGVAYCLEEDEA